MHACLCLRMLCYWKFGVGSWFFTGVQPDRLSAVLSSQQQWVSELMSEDISSRKNRRNRMIMRPWATSRVSVFPLNAYCWSTHHDWSCGVWSEIWDERRHGLGYQTFGVATLQFALVGSGHLKDTQARCRFCQQPLVVEGRQWRGHLIGNRILSKKRF